MLDTAVAYGDSEDCLGELGTADFQVVTKLPPLDSGVVDVQRWVVDQVLASLSRLRRKTLYGLLLHRPDDLLGPRGEELSRAVVRMLDDGLVGKAGVSIYDPGQLDALSSAMPIGLVQAPFNVLDRRLATSGWLDRLQTGGVEVHTRSMFLQGLLVMETSSLASRFAKWMELLQSWHRWLETNHLSAAEACVRFAMSESRIARLVVGCDNVDQLEEIALFVLRGPLQVPISISSEDVDLLNPARWPKA